MPNPSFEIYSSCPNGPSTPGYDKVAYATGWNSYGDTPDYFNSCASVSSNVNVPNNFCGFQYANTGNAYCGLFAYMTGDFREYMGCQLISPLSIGQKYYVAFKISRASGSMFTMSCNKIGIRFSTQQYSQTSPFHPDNFEHIYSNIISTDTTNWITISDSFIADSAYSHLIIGNFFDDNHTDTLSAGPSPYRAYYFVDDIYVSTDSLSSITEPQFSYVKILSNPVSYFLEIKNIAQKTHFTIITIHGAEIYSGEISKENSQIDVAHLPPGIYFLMLNDDEYYKFIIAH